MADTKDDKIYIQFKFPEGVKEIVEAVHSEIKSGKILGDSTDNLENGAKQIIARVKDKWLRTPNKSIEAMEWAQTEWFRLLLIDLDRLNCFRNHNMCQPEKQKER